MSYYVQLKITKRRPRKDRKDSDDIVCFPSFDAKDDAELRELMTHAIDESLLAIHRREDQG